MGIVRFFANHLGNIFSKYFYWLYTEKYGVFFQVFKEFGRKNVACEHYPVTLLQIPCM